MGIKRYIDRTICGAKFQKSCYIEGSLNLAILAFGDDGLSHNRLMVGQLRGSNQVQSKDQLTFTDNGLFVDLRTSERKLYPDRLSISSTKRGKSSTNDGTWRIPWLGDGDGNVTSTTKKILPFGLGGNNRNGV